MKPNYSPKLLISLLAGLLSLCVVLITGAIFRSESRTRVEKSTTEFDSGNLNNEVIRRPSNMAPASIGDGAERETSIEMLTGDLGVEAQQEALAALFESDSLSTNEKAAKLWAAAAAAKDHPAAVLYWLAKVQPLPSEISAEMLKMFGASNDPGVKDTILSGLSGAVDANPDCSPEMASWLLTTLQNGQEDPATVRQMLDLLAQIDPAISIPVLQASRDGIFHQTGDESAFYEAGWTIALRHLDTGFIGEMLKDPALLIASHDPAILNVIYDLSISADWTETPHDLLFEMFLVGTQPSSETEPELFGKWHAAALAVSGVNDAPIRAVETIRSATTDAAKAALLIYGPKVDGHLSGAEKAQMAGQFSASLASQPEQMNAYLLKEAVKLLTGMAPHSD